MKAYLVNTMARLWIIQSALHIRDKFCTHSPIPKDGTVALSERDPNRITVYGDARDSSDLLQLRNLAPFETTKK